MEAGEGKGGWPVPGGSPHHPRGRCCGPDPPAVGRGLRIPCCSSPQPLPHPGPQVCLCWGQRLDGSGPAGPWDAGADFPVEALKSWLCCGHCCQPSDLMLCGCGVEVDSRVPGHPAQAPSPQRFLSLSRSFFLGNWEGGSRLSLLWPEHGLCAVSISSWVSLALLLPPLHVFSAPPPPPAPVPSSLLLSSIPLSLPSLPLPLSFLSLLRCSSWISKEMEARVDWRAPQMTGRCQPGPQGGPRATAAPSPALLRVWLGSSQMSTV